MPSIAIAIAPDADLSDPASWVFEDITEFAQKPGISLTYGRRDEGSQVDTSTVNLQLDNRDGRFTRLNPLSPYFGRIRSGTPIRITITGGGSRLLLAQDGARCAAPHAASHDLAGDLDLRIEYNPAVPEPVTAGVPNSQPLAMRYETVGDQRAWLLSHTSTGSNRLRWSLDGTFGAIQIADSPVLPLGPNGRRAIWVTVEENVAGQHRIIWRWAATLAGPWVLLSQETRAGTTAIATSTAPLTVGADAAGGSVIVGFITLRGGVYGLQLRDGVDGTLVVSPDFTAATLGTGGFTDAQGNTWTPAGGGSYSDEYELFQGFVAEWPTRWDRMARESWVPITANGQLRRLQRRDRQAAKSVIHRMVLANLRDG